MGTGEVARASRSGSPEVVIDGLHPRSVSYSNGRNKRQISIRRKGMDFGSSGSRSCCLSCCNPETYRVLGTQCYLVNSCG